MSMAKLKWVLIGIAVAFGLRALFTLLRPDWTSPQALNAAITSSIIVALTLFIIRSKYTVTKPAFIPKKKRRIIALLVFFGWLLCTAGVTWQVRVQQGAEALTPAFLIGLWVLSGTICAGAYHLAMIVSSKLAEEQNRTAKTMGSPRFRIQHERLRQWLRRELRAQQSDAEADDIHIDEAVIAWPSASDILEVSLSLFAACLDERRIEPSEDSLALCLPLRTDLSWETSDVWDRSRIERELDTHAVPSVFMFKLGKEPWVSEEGCVRAKCCLELKGTCVETCYYSSVAEPVTHEPTRTLWIPDEGLL
ncbi:MAG: hypothetical protein ACYTAN_13880 [Planctomycetota bacterium]